MTDPLGQSQVLPYLKGIAAKDYEIHLVSFEKTDRYRQHKKYIRSLCDESGIHWHPQDYHNEGGLRKTLRQVGKMKKVASYLHEKHHFDLVHCRSYIASIAGLRLKKRHGIPFIFDMRGFWADERVDGGLWNLSNPLYRIIYKYFKHLERRFLSEADYIVSLTERGKSEIERMQIPQVSPIQVIPCCVDLEIFTRRNFAESRYAYRKKIGLTADAFVLGYIGSIGTWYMLPEMLHYFKHLSARRSDAVFVFITKEPENQIRTEAEKQGISMNRIIVHTCLHKEVPSYIATFDVSIFFIKPAFSKLASSPTKQGEIMAMGIPVVCNSGVGDTDHIIEKSKAGIVIHDLTNFNDEAFFSFDNFESETIRKGACDFFSLDEGVQRYLEIYTKVLD